MKWITENEEPRPAHCMMGDEYWGLGRSSSAEQGENNNNNNNNNNNYYYYYYYYYVMTSDMMKPQMMIVLKLHVLLQIMKEIYACRLCYVMEINVTF